MYCEDYHCEESVPILSQDVFFSDLRIITSIFIFTSLVTTGSISSAVNIWIILFSPTQLECPIWKNRAIALLIYITVIIKRCHLPMPMIIYIVTPTLSENKLEKLKNEMPIFSYKIAKRSASAGPQCMSKNILYQFSPTI